MNILIVTPFYKHDRNIASVRWTNIGIRLAKKHNVIVVTQPHNDMDMNITIGKDEDGILVARINQKTNYEKIAIKHFGGETGDDWQTKSNTDHYEQRRDDFKRILKNRILYASMKSKAKKYAKIISRSVIPEGMRIDVVISSACPFIEMLFGHQLKKELECKWICDFRDLPFAQDNCDSTHQEKTIMKSVLNDADAIITIANKGKDRLVDGIVNDPQKIHVIRNGYSLTDARETTTVKDNLLHLAHTGSLYGGKSKADLLFRAIKEIYKKEPSFQYVLECAGGNNSSLLNTSKEYSEETNIVDLGFVPREEALDLQSRSDMLLVLVRDKPGSVAAKIYEYMLNKKPIICITCGESEGISEETNLIRELNLGIAVEENEGQSAIDILSTYLLEQWKRKINGESLEYSPIIEKINEFNHDTITKKIEQLCFSVI